MDSNEGKVVLNEAEIRSRVKALAREISADYEGLTPILVAVLRGAVFFLVDLSRELTVPHTIDFLGISGYGPRTQTGVVRITKDLDMDIHERHVLIVEDIVDTGLTLHYLTRSLRERGPASLKTCTFLDRSAQRIADLHIDYKGFEIDEEYVVGYGLDYEEKWRSLKHVVAIKE